MRKWVGAALGAAMVIGMTPAMAASTVEFDFSGTSSTTGTAGNTRTFSATSDDGVTVNVMATAWSATRDNRGNYSISDAYLGSYDKGLGVTSSTRNNPDNSHTIDNSGRYDFVVLQFDQIVDLDTASLTAFGNDLDISVAIGSVSSAWDAVLGTSDLAALLAGYVNFDASNIRNGNTYPIGINPSGVEGNVLLLAANLSGKDKDDYFKFGGLTAAATPAVPEPATWAMMIAGFGLVGAAMRRRRPAITHVAA